MTVRCPPCRRARATLALGAGLLLGSSWSAPGQTLQILDGENQTDNFGTSIARAGDVNNDGIPDYAISAYHVNGPAAIQFGGVYVYSGLDNSVLHYWEGSNYKDHFGASVIGAGDVNNDGFADILIGCELCQPTGVAAQGRAFLYSGKDGTVLQIFDGEAGGDFFGTAVARLDDIDQDGFDDFIVGAKGYDAQVSSEGRVYVYSGQTLTPLLVLDGESDGDNFGHAISAVEDVNGDDIDDFLVGAPLNQAGGLFSGRAYLYSGHSGTLMNTIQGGPLDLLGFSVFDAGDMNKDGSEDLLVGGIYGNNLFGTSLVCDSTTSNVIHSWAGAAKDDWFGFAVGSNGDFNGDGYSDAVVGAPTNDDLYLDAGFAYVYSGKSGNLLAKFSKEEPDATTGLAVAFLNDLNDDGFDEVAVSAPGADFLEPGSVIIALGGDVFVDVLPRKSKPGSDISFNVRGDYPNGQWLIVVTEVNGQPFERTIGPGPLDASGAASLPITLSPTATQVVLKLRAFVQDAGGELHRSGTIQLEVE